MVITNEKNEQVSGGNEDPIPKNSTTKSNILKFRKIWNILYNSNRGRYFFSKLFSLCSACFKVLNRTVHQETKEKQSREK